MKIWKISAVAVFLAIAIFISNLFAIPTCFAENESYRICTDSCSIFVQPNSSLDETNILETKVYGDIIDIDPTEILDLTAGSNLKYYPVLEGTNIVGYVLSSTVVKSDNVELKVNFQSNAKLNAICFVYDIFGNSYNHMTYNGENIQLDKDTPIKLLNGYDKNSEYTQVSFEFDNKIITGYVKTANVKIGGFNYYFLIAIFLLFIIFSTVIPIVVKNWKKKKKLSNG